MASQRGIFLEVTARKGHSLTNGHVARQALRQGALMVLDSDAHGPEDLLEPDLTHKIAKGAGLSDEETHALLTVNPERLLDKLGYSISLPSR